MINMLEVWRHGGRESNSKLCPYIRFLFFFEQIRYIFHCKSSFCLTNLFMTWLSRSRARRERTNLLTNVWTCFVDDRQAKDRRTISSNERRKSSLHPLIDGYTIFNTSKEGTDLIAMEDELSVWRYWLPFLPFLPSSSSPPPPSFSFEVVKTTKRRKREETTK